STRSNAGPQSISSSEREVTPQGEVKSAAQRAPSGSSSQQRGVRDLKDPPQGGAINRTPTGSTGSSKIPIIPISSGMVRDAQNVYRFDEEDDKELELDEQDREDEDHE